MVQFDEFTDDLKSASVVLIGIPFDRQSSYMRGPALAPERVREVLHGGVTNLCSETGIDLGDTKGFRDLGDIKIDNSSAWIDDIEKRISHFLDHDVRVLSLGGDHAITYPIAKAYAKKYGAITILQLDAHPDLYDEYEGNRYSHACSFARILEEKLAMRLVQVGIRTLNPHQRRQVERFGVEVVEMRHYDPESDSNIIDPVYLSIDLDVLDPAFAPGVSHHEPGGMSTRQVVELIHRLQVPIVGADIVEYNPRRDPTEITAMAAVKLLKEVAARMLEQCEK